METKADIIQEAIDNQMYLTFDYVSTSRKISIGRLVQPIEIQLSDKHGMKVWCKDIKVGGLLKQFDLEGIQDPKLIDGQGVKNS